MSLRGSLGLLILLALFLQLVQFRSQFLQLLGLHADVGRVHAALLFQSLQLFLLGLGVLTFMRQRRLMKKKKRNFFYFNYDKRT